MNSIEKYPEPKLILSPHLRIIEKPWASNIIIYHSLYWLPFQCEKIVLDYLYSKNWLSINDLDEEIISLLKDTRLIVDSHEKELSEFKNITKEYRDKAIEWNNIKNLDLLVSEACNLWCTHCILFNSLEWWDIERKNKIMSRDQAKKILDEYVKIIKKNWEKKLDIHFWSWEPLLNLEVIKKTVEYIKTEYKDYESVFSINTNLTLLNDEIAEFLKFHDIDTHVSLDWLKQSNDTIRTTKKWEWTFDKIVSWMDLLEKVWYPLTWISLTITNKNFHLVWKDFIDRCINRGMNNIAIDIDLISTISLDWITIENVIAKLVDLFFYAENHWVEVIGTRLTPYINLKNKSILEWDEVFFCAAVKWSNLAVSRDGSTTTCSYTTTKIWNIFNLEVWPQSDLWRLVQARTPWASDYCSWCNIEWHCAWQCHVTKEIANSTNNPELIYKMCEFYRWVTYKLLSEEIT